MERWWRAGDFRVRGHYATLKRLFEEEEPPRTLKWRKVVALFDACGVDFWSSPGDGTRLRVDDVRERIRTPGTPDEDVPPTTLRKIRTFLRTAGVKPDVIWDFLAREEVQQ